jgi:mannitol-1-phosphate/altronate dehydrogenase
MLHIHFGCGRLGLGLVAPFFQTSESELYLLNRAVSGLKPTGSTELSSQRRNELLAGNPDKFYVIQELGASDSGRRIVHYDGFFTYDDDNIASVVQSLAETSKQKQEGLIVTASVLNASNYGPVVQALNCLADMRDHGQVGPLFLVACENTLNALEVLQDADLSDKISDAPRRHVRCVHALVDRMCVNLEEDQKADHPTVVVRVEAYGMLKLELSEQTDELMKKLAASRIEFSHHVAVEKQIKSWLLNGSHWLIALAAYEASEADRNLKLNKFLREKADREQFAASVMQEMREGVAAILRGDPQYADFVREVDVDRYLERASEAILDRFMTNDDPITRILARFQKPTPESLTTIQAFSKRFAERVDEPIAAYQADKGMPPLAAMHSMHSLVRLIASGSFINATQA